MVRAGIGLDLLGVSILTPLVYALDIPVFGVLPDGSPLGPANSGQRRIPPLGKKPQEPHRVVPLVFS